MTLQEYVTELESELGKAQTSLKSVAAVLGNLKKYVTELEEGVPALLEKQLLCKIYPGNMDEIVNQFVPPTNQFDQPIYNSHLKPKS